MKAKFTQDQSGFTLIELVIVVMILGIIATISIVNFSRVFVNSTATACKTDWQTASNAVQAFFNDNPTADISASTYSDLYSATTLNTLPNLGYLKALTVSTPQKYKIFLKGYVPISTTSTSGSGGVATIGTATAHSLSVGDEVTISGVLPFAYNGTFVVTAVPSTTSFSYASNATGTQTQAGTATESASVLVALAPNLGLDQAIPANNPSACDSL